MELEVNNLSEILSKGNEGRKMRTVTLELQWLRERRSKINKLN